MFKSHFAVINSAIQNPISLAGQLFQAQLIGRQLLADVTTPGLQHNYQVNKLMQCVLSQIELSADNLYIFIKVLEKDSSLSELEKQLKMKFLF